MGGGGLDRARGQTKEAQPHNDSELARDLNLPYHKNSNATATSTSASSSTKTCKRKTTAPHLETETPAPLMHPIDSVTPDGEKTPLPPPKNTQKRDMQGQRRDASYTRHITRHTTT